MASAEPIVAPSVLLLSVYIWISPAFSNFASSILPYYSTNSSALIYPPPILITSLPFIIFAIICLDPNIYLPGPSLLTGIWRPAALRALPKDSSIASPLTALYTVGSSFLFNYYLSLAYFWFNSFLSWISAFNSLSKSWIGLRYLQFKDSI